MYNRERGDPLFLVLSLSVHMVRMKRLTGIVILAVQCVTGCGNDVGSELGRRKITEAPVDVVWERVIGSADSTLALPSKVTLAATTLAVLDPSLGRIVGLSKRSGETVWQYGSTGSGPRELKEPTDIVLDERGNFVVVDAGNSKLLTISESGVFLAERPMPAAGARSICLYRDGRALVSQLALGSPLIAFDEKATSARTIAFPWPLDSGDPVRLSPEQQPGEYVRLTQAVLLPDLRGHCLVARQTAPGIALVAEDSVLWRNDELEAPPADSLRTSTSTIIATALLGDTVFAAYHGVGKLRGRLLDRYSLNTGEYIDSWRAPDNISWISGHGREIASLKITSTGGKISLWRVR